MLCRCTPRSSDTAANPGSASHGDEWIDDARAVTAGASPIDPSGVSGSATCTLPARYEAVGGARRFTRTTLTGWGLADRFDDVALVVSELVTNALRHALPSDSTAPESQDPRYGCT